nr:sporulation integral membrane protein YlbJ [Aceticella autotrophica]
MIIKKFFHYIFLLLLVLGVISLIIFPKNSLEAAKNGIDLWLFTVTPALLPFFIGSELLLQFGIVNLLGKLLEPIMKPLFNVSGSGSFPMAIGYTSGYPVGAQIISRLWEEKLCTTIEAERLMSFCNNSGPLFMLGVVGTGMFNNSKIGYIIMSANYLGAICTGILFRNYKFSKKTKYPDAYNKKVENNVIRKNFGNILSDAIKSSMNTIFLIGGYIIIFSVLIEYLKLFNIIYILSNLIYPIFKVLGFHKEILPGFISGLMEITVGSKLISQSAAPLYQKIIIVSIILSWGGFSTHGQVISIISNTKISYLPYLFSKIINSIFTAFYSYIILLFVKVREEQNVTVFNQYNINIVFNILQLSLYIFTITVLIFVLISLLIKTIAKGT